MEIKVDWDIIHSFLLPFLCFFTNYNEYSKEVKVG